MTTAIETTVEVYSEKLAKEIQVAELMVVWSREADGGPLYAHAPFKARGDRDVVCANDLIIFTSVPECRDDVVAHLNHKFKGVTLEHVTTLLIEAQQ